MSMTGKFKQSVKEFLPPILVKFLTKGFRYGFSGDYKTWEEAKNASTSYHSDVILNKVKDSLLKVKEGKAACERDSSLFDEIQYPWPLLAGLLRAAVDNGGKLSVLDFGGSLGSSYFQCRDFLPNLNDLRWGIVEQENFVDCGKNFFEDEHLKFYHDIETCIKNESPNVIILSAVIQYLERPYEFLENILKKDFYYIILDRTPFVEAGGDRLTIQKVSPKIYNASYPAWFFNEKKFLNLFFEKYELMAEFYALDRVNIPSNFKGFIFKRRL
jgi:putative methyltransferase (TIGR04325 family)